MPIVSPFFSKQRGNKSMDLKLGVIHPGTMIGMNDLLFDRTNVFSLKCISIIGKVKIINADDFLNKMKRD